MKMYELNTKIQDIISTQTGIPFEDIADMDDEDIDTCIEKKSRKKLVFNDNKDDRFFGRGSMYIALGRLFSMRKIYRRIKRI